MSQVGQDELLLNTLFEHTPVGISVIDRDLRYVRINDTLARSNGSTPAAHIGRTVREMRPGLADTLEPLLKRVLREGTPLIDMRIRVESGADAGKDRYWRASYYPIGGVPGRTEAVCCIVTDITADRVAEELRQSLALRESEERNLSLILETASRVALDILSQSAGIDALRHIAEAARSLAGAEYAALGVANSDGIGLSEFVTVGLTAEQEAAIGPRPIGRGILGHLLTRSEPLRIGVLADHPASVGFPANHPVMDSFLGVPIRRGDMVIGSLYLSNKIGDAGFTAADEAAVEALGAHAAIAIHSFQMLSRQRTLLAGIIAAQEEERRAVAYELHDGLTQYVMASHAHFDGFRRAHLAGNVARADREMEQTERYLKNAVVESRRLVNGLRALALDDLGLAGAVEQLLSEEKVRAEWEGAELVHNIAAVRFDKTLETAAYRVVQEALTNVRKHAEAPRVRVRLLTKVDALTGKQLLTIEVADWGKGFRPEAKAGDYAHVGLHGMAERVSLAGGSFELLSAPGEGTKIRAIFPVPGPAVTVSAPKRAEGSGTDE